MLVDSQLQLLRKSVLVGADGRETRPLQLPSKYGLFAEIDPQKAVQNTRMTRPPIELDMEEDPYM